VLSDIVKRGSCRSFAVTQVTCSEQCLRLQPQADILEAQDNVEAIAKAKAEASSGALLSSRQKRGAGSIPRSKAGLSCHVFCANEKSFE
jgi:hypothetical protein